MFFKVGFHRLHIILHCNNKFVITLGRTHFYGVFRKILFYISDFL